MSQNKTQHIKRNTKSSSTQQCKIQKLSGVQRRKLQPNNEGKKSINSNRQEMTDDRMVKYIETVMFSQMFQKREESRSLEGETWKI